VAKTATCCICMWKLSFLKYGNTHLISELYYKINQVEPASVQPTKKILEESVATTDFIKVEI
jgi:hypothetical protein